MKPPRITLVMPSFNQAAYLEEALRSVLEQGYPNLQFGVIDGGSTDGSIAILERYRAHLDFLIIEKDNGQSDALNKGLARADGEVVGWLNSDDTLLPGALKYVGAYFAAHPATDWLIGCARRTDASGRTLGRLEPVGEFTPAGALLRSAPFCVPQPACFWKRAILERTGLLDTALHHCMDFELWVRMLLAGYRPALVAEELATYREQPESKTCAQAEKFIAALIDIEQRYLSRLTPAEAKVLRRRIGYQKRALAARQDRAKLVRAVCRRPWWLLSQQIRQALAGR